jgi:hypothetical protein
LTVDERLHPPKSQALKEMFWRSEILQVIYWLRGEQFGLGPRRDHVDPVMLERFLGVDPAVSVQYLDLLVDRGDLEREGGLYRLSEDGVKEGALEFAASWSDLTRPTHGECSADCWCHNSPEEAAACQQERLGAHADHDH